MEERIGDPDLFVGRKEELSYYLNWIDNIKRRMSKSTAILARRKMGKTAILERLFNITFDRNNGVIPFYYEVREVEVWAVSFCKDFFLTFISQYIAFKSRKLVYMDLVGESDFKKVALAANTEGLDYLTEIIESVEYAAQHEEVDRLWNIVREAPKKIAFAQKEFIVQMIDEFQFLNNKIFRDKALKNRHDTIAGGYLSTAESKVAPLLVSGSWVGWLMDMLTMMLPSRFKFNTLGNLPEDEAIEMVFKYSRFFNVPVTEETAFLIAQLSEGSPFYISAIIQSLYRDKDLTTIDGLVRTLEFETRDDRGEIKFTWMEYVTNAFHRVNDRNAKNIVLYLCRNKNREITRKELLENLQLDMTDAELEKRLKALVRADIIKQGSTNFDYRGVQDNIFDKVFRGVYQKEIDHFDPATLKTEYKEAFEKLQKEYRCLQGQFNYKKGYFAEYLIPDQLRFYGTSRNKKLKSVTRNLPGNFDFCEYESVWTYRTAVEYTRGLSVDILARARSPEDYSIIGEVKNRDTRKFSKTEAVEFTAKLDTIKEKEKLDRAVGFIFSRTGFTAEAKQFLQQKGIAYTEDETWLEP